MPHTRALVPCGRQLDCLDWYETYQTLAPECLLAILLAPNGFGFVQPDLITRRWETLFPLLARPNSLTGRLELFSKSFTFASSRLYVFSFFPDFLMCEEHPSSATRLGDQYLRRRLLLSRMTRLALDYGRILSGILLAVLVGVYDACRQ